MSQPKQNEPSEIPTLIWADDFDYSGLPDANKWTFAVGDGCPKMCGWGNNELQFYTDSTLDNARVEDSRLIIEARKQDKEKRAYTSAKLLSNESWKYGRLEVRAMLPTGRGIWPAVWMLPTLDRPMQWPLDGEIDIMEQVGFDPNNIHGTIHTKAYNHVDGTDKTGDILLENPTEAFHVYAIEWTEDKIEWFVDGASYHLVEKTASDGKEEWPFNEPFHLILNVAVGGNWGGKEGVDDNIFPQKLEIDYVHVYAVE